MEDRGTRGTGIGRALTATALLALAALALGAVPASAHTVPATCEPRAIPPTGEAVMSPNVEHLGTFHDEGLDMTAGGRRVGDRFYITGVSHFSVYDISKPAEPKLLSRVDFACRFENEDVAADERTLVYSDFATEGALYIYDISNGAEPKQVAEIPAAGTHTMTCVLDCNYLYGSYKANGPAGALTGGEVVDISDPAKPRVLGDWTDKGVLESRKVHDLTEIAPGLVLTASAPIQLMDVRKDKVEPAVLAHGPDPAKRWHSVEWPRNGLDRWVLATYETNATPRCEAGVGDFAIFDARDVAETGELEQLESYFLTNDNNDESMGNPTVNAGLGCSPHWFKTRPDWHDGGVVATGAYDHGAKFLRIDPMGNISEIGHFRAPGTNASAAYWITCEIVYIVDYTRGFDVLRFDDGSAQCGADTPPEGTPEADAKLETFAARVKPRWWVRRPFGYTQLTGLDVSGLPLAASVSVKCRGDGCAKRSNRSLNVEKGSATTRTALARKRLRPGARVIVRISRPGAVTQKVSWRVRAAKKPRRIG